jgi:hypothetical protein
MELLHLVVSEVEIEVLQVISTKMEDQWEALEEVSQPWVVEELPEYKRIQQLVVLGHMEEAKAHSHTNTVALEEV